MPLPAARTPAEITLIATNLLPLAGVLLWGWKAFDILFLYWAENVVIGIFNVLKMIFLIKRRKIWLAFPIVPFFVFHYSGFVAVHGVFVVLLFGLALTKNAAGQPPNIEDVLHGIVTDPFFGLAAAALVFSHGVSFFVNYLGRDEIARTSLPDLMVAPYGRIVVMHLTILIGGFVAMAAGQPLWALVLLTVMKTAGDLRAHRRSHANIQNAKPQTAPSATVGEKPAR